MHSKLGEPNLAELIGMFAQAPIGFCCFDRDLRFLFINNCLAQINGISAHCTTVVAEGGDRWSSGGLFFAKRSVP